METERPPKCRAFYSKLLKFYPRPFRDRFGESMEQTFDDLCQDEKGHGSRLVSLTIRLSVDTGIGIVKEHVLHLSQRRIMSEVLRNPRIALLVGLLLFLPGALMFAGLMLNIEPPLGPLDSVLNPPGDGPHLLGSLVALALIIVLPTAGVILSAAAADGRAIKNICSSLGVATTIASLLVAPLLILELTYGQKSYTSFPTSLFVILWLVPVIFVALAMPLAQAQGAGQSLAKHPVTLLLRVALLILLAIFWTGLVNDQMPCFLGVPNCD